MNIPKVGDVISVKTESFTGDVTVTYIDEPSLFVHHFFPIQAEISPDDLHKVDNHHGQTLMRFSLKDIVSEEKVEPVKPAITENTQLDLFNF